MIQFLSDHLEVSHLQNQMAREDISERLREMHDAQLSQTLVHLGS